MSFWIQTNVFHTYYLINSITAHFTTIHHFNVLQIRLESYKYFTLYIDGKESLGQYYRQLGVNFKIVWLEDCLGG